MSKFRRMIFAVVAFLTGTILPFPDQAAADEISQFKPSTEQAWREYLEYLKRLQGTCDYVHSQEGNGISTPFRRGRVEYGQNKRGCAFYINHPDEDSKPSEGYVVNARYLFKIRRKTQSSAWVLSAVEKVMLPPPEVNGETVARTVLKGICPQLQLINQWLPDCRDELVWSLPTSGSPLSDGFVRLAFRRYDDPKLQLQVPEGVVVFAPKQSWVVRSFEGVNVDRVGGRAAVTQEYTYRDDTSRFPVVSRFIQKSRVISDPLEVTNKGKVGVYDLRFDLREADRPDDDFTLSAFGFPEPAELSAPRRGGSSIWAWLTAAGASCLVLAIVAFYAARRLRAAP